MAACLWQALPASSNQSILRAIELSGNHVTHPDSLLGYGIPDFVKALHHMNVDNRGVENLAKVYPNPFSGEFSVSFNATKDQEITILLVNNLGMIVSAIKRTARAGANEVTFPDLKSLPDGNYVLQIIGNDLLLNSKTIKVTN